MPGRIQVEWHEIAQAKTQSAKAKITLRLKTDVVKFFRSIGPDYGPPINDVLSSYMHKRLARVIRGRRRFPIIGTGGLTRGRRRGSRGRSGSRCRAL
jgi:hypothetical protein